VKLVKNKAYHKRFQVKYRRRREGKTDYFARKRLVMQDKNKYQSHRYRLVVRFTNTTVITQVVYSEIDGDHVLVSAYSSELPSYGLKVGLKNYAAAYATGLLLARRALKKLELAEMYAGNKTVDGKVYEIEEQDRRPFKAVLDVGTRATTTGARLFGALKGASDGGVLVPHNEKRFPGYNKESKEFNADAHKSRIFGGHVSAYMKSLQEDDADKYQRQFSKFTENGVEADGMEALYKKVHAAIRKNPDRKPKPAAKAHDARYKRPVRRNAAQRKDRVKQKKASRLHALRNAEADD